METNDGNGYVTWKQLVLFATPIIAIPIVVFWAVLNEHSSQPHDGAVRTHEIAIIERQIDRIESDVRDIRNMVIQIQGTFGGSSRNPRPYTSEP